MNRLASESSLYLRQHAGNPVDWYPWGEEALRLAREEDKPILLSIGYSACHWCHVMAHECFESPAIAAVLNERFVSVKVDREERPDLDTVYMEAVQAISGHGGWPLTAFLTPDGRPFFAGTYFPPDDHGSQPGLATLARELSDAYRHKRRQVAAAAERIMGKLETWQGLAVEQTGLDDCLLSQAAQQLQSGFDWERGGFGGAPKFPQPMVYEFLLRHHVRYGDNESRQMVQLTLDKMARGGIRDHLGGGFHRYAVDDSWSVPHYEKMLYDNAQLARLYLHGYQVTADVRYREVAESGVSWLLRELLLPEGGFCASMDADTAGEEGLYYLWTVDELASALGAEDGALAERWFSVGAPGDLNGASALRELHDSPAFADSWGVGEAELVERLGGIRSRLLAERQKRVTPARDDKVLAAWNGLAIGALAEAGVVLDREDWLWAAERAAHFVCSAMVSEGLLHRCWTAGRLSGPGFLEDYALVCDGLLALHQATLGERWLSEAQSLAESIVEQFWDADVGAFFDSGAMHERLVLRPRSIMDNALPCGASAATSVLLRLAAIDGREDYRGIAVRALAGAADLMERFPTGLGNWLCALDFHSRHYLQVVSLPRGQGAESRAMLREVLRPFVPNRVLAGRTQRR